MVQGNLIGTQKNGISPLGNDDEGVYVDTPDNTIGGTGQGAANVIGFNARQGVFVEFVGVDNTGNRILGNSIFSNGRLWIDLRSGTENAAGATKNDPGDADTGANDLQNKPSLTYAVTSDGKTTVKGRLVSSPGDPFLIQLFSNVSGNEGKTFIGSKSVSTNANGVAVFEFAASRAGPSRHGITATATDVGGANTSEFSAPRTVAAR